MLGGDYETMLKETGYKGDGELILNTDSCAQGGHENTTGQVLRLSMRDIRHVETVPLQRVGNLSGFNERQKISCRSLIL
jgi:hypothetical protein